MSLLILGDQPVVLDRDVAAGFGVQLRALNQVVARNPEMFDGRHVVRLTGGQRDWLRTQGVLPTPLGRGGNRALPMAYTQKGVARLATVLTSRRALDFTDAMIDLAIEVHRQIAQGVEAPHIADASRYLPAPPEEARALRRVRERILTQVEQLLSSWIGEDGPTVREGLSETATSLYEDLRARLKTRALENEKLVAETLLLMEEVEKARQDRRLAARRADLEDEAIHLGNLKARIDLIRESVALLDRTEAPAIARLNQPFLPGPASVTLRLPAPEPDEDA